MTVNAGTYVMVHAGTKHGIIAVTDCKMITVGCAVLSGHHCRYFEEQIDYHENS